MTTTLLAVDDSKTMRRVLEITFAGENYKVVVAENGDQALSKLGAERPGVVLIDAALEGTNGYELCAKVKAAQPGALVVLLSNKHQPYDRNRGTQVAVDDFMDKPFDTQQMLDKVTALLKKGASASSPMAAPAPQPQMEASARLRAQTLSYGNQIPAAPGAAPTPPPAAAARPAPAPAPVAAVPVASRAPVPAVSRQPTMIGTPVPPELAMPRPAAAPAPVAAPVAAAAAALTSNGSQMAEKLGALGLSKDQADAVLKLSREVVEQVVWEVVPTLAEALIKEEIRRLTSE